MPDRILLTTPFGVRIIDGMAYLDCVSDDRIYELAMSVPNLLSSLAHIQRAVVNFR